MVDPCRLNLSVCLNNGICAVNSSLNTTHCQCDSCHYGIFCENDVWKQTHFDTFYIYFIIYIVGLGFSILNNSLALELFIRSRRIRCTNCGTFLIVYAILSLLSSIFLVADGTVIYYKNLLSSDQKKRVEFHCYVGKIGYNLSMYLSIWFSACVAFERGLVILEGGKMSANRWRSVLTSIVILIVAGGYVTPLLMYKCDWDNVPNLQDVRGFCVWFYPVVGFTIYVLATLLVLIGFASRIRKYGTEKGSFLKTYFKLLRSHLFIFIPPIVYAVSFIPYTIVNNLGNPEHSYFQCGISPGEYIVKVLLEALTGVPIVITWLLFVYPSRVYMTEFYLNTWSGECCAKVFIFFQSFAKWKNENPCSYANTTHSTQRISVFVVEVQLPDECEQ